MKYLKVSFSNGEIYSISAEIIAKNRADYYAAIDAVDIGGKEWQEEVDYALKDSYEIIDWVSNNTDWKDIKEHAKLIEKKDINYDVEFPNAEKEII